MNQPEATVMMRSTSRGSAVDVFVFTLTLCRDSHRVALQFARLMPARAFQRVSLIAASGGGRRTPMRACRVDRPAMKLTQRRTTRTVGAAAGLAVVLAVAGCSSPTEKVRGQLEVALQQVVSASRSGILALDQYRSGSTLESAADTALDDALTDVSSEQSESASLDVSTSSERQLQQRSVRVADGVADALSGARAALAEGSSPRVDAARDQLGKADRAAENWATQLGKGAP